MYICLKPEWGLRSYKYDGNRKYLIINKNRRNKGYEIDKGLYDFLRYFCDGKKFIPSEDELPDNVNPGMFVASEKSIEDFEFSKWQIAGDNIPYHPELEVAITQRCNYDCVYCFETADDSPLTDSFTLEEFNKLMDEALDCGVTFIALTGGEPMMHKQFYELINNVDEHGLMVSEILTNGSLITESFLKDIKKLDACKNTKFCISFDGINGKHDLLRKTNSEKNVLKNIKLCLDNDFDVKVTYNLNNLNYDELKDTTLAISELGVSEFRIARTMPSRKLRIINDQAVLTHTEWLDTALDFVKWYISIPDFKMRVDFWDVCDINPESKVIFLNSIKGCEKTEYDNNRLMCPLTYYRVGICGDGLMVPCHQISGGMRKQGIDLGNVKTDGLKKIFTNSNWLDLVTTKVADRLKHQEKCANCRHWKMCLGGCPYIGAPWRWEYGEHFPFSTDVTQCAFFEGGYYDKFKEIVDNNDEWWIYSTLSDGGQLCQD